MKKEMLLCSALIAMCACSENENEDVIVQDSIVEFSGTIIPTTRATDSSFDNGDEISVFATLQSSTSLYADNVRYRWNSSSNQFAGVNGGIVVPGSATTYYAIYPYQTYDHVDSDVSDLKFNFTVFTNQSYSSNYTLSDLCTAVTSPTISDKVDLTFGHRLSKMVVNFIGQSIPSDIIVQLKNVQTEVTMDLKSNTYICGGNSYMVTMANNGNNSFKAVVPTQTVSSIVIYQGSQSKEIALNKELSAGKQSEITIEVKGDTYVVVGGSLSDWEEENKDEEEPQSPEIIFEDPYLDWGGTVSAVKQYMQTGGYLLLQDITQASSNYYYLVYSGKNKELASQYYFSTAEGNLQQVYVLFIPEAVSLDEIVALFQADNRYEYLGYNTEHGVHIIQSKHNQNTIVNIYYNEESDVNVVNYFDYSLLNQSSARAFNEKRFYDTW